MGRLAVIDYSGSGAYPIQTLRPQYGIESVCRYLELRNLPGNPYPYVTSNKGLTEGEQERIREAGLGCVYIFEGSGREPLNGYAQGTKDGRNARIAMERLGVPDHTVVWNADFSVTQSQFTVCAQYAEGFNDGGGHGLQIGYGPGAMLQFCADRELIKFGWQWAGAGTTVHCAHMHQRKINPWPLTFQYDTNEVFSENYGQFPYYPPPPPAYTGKDDKMQQIFRVVDGQNPTAVYVTDFMTYRWLPTNDAVAALQYVIGTHGGDAAVGEVHKNQIGFAGNYVDPNGIPAVNPYL